MNKHEFVTLTPAIAQRFYGARTARSMRGWAYLRDGEPLVIWGLMRDPYRWVLFSEWTPEARGRTFTDRRLILKALEHLKEALARVRGPIHAAPDSAVAGACELLERAGFVHINQGIYQWQAPQPTSQPH